MMIMILLSNIHQILANKVQKNFMRMRRWSIIPTLQGGGRWPPNGGCQQDDHDESDVVVDNDDSAAGDVGALTVGKYSAASVIDDEMKMVVMLMVEMLMAEMLMQVMMMMM